MDRALFLVATTKRQLAISRKLFLSILQQPKSPAPAFKPYNRDFQEDTHVQNSPMQISPQKWLHLCHLQTLQFHAANLLLAPPVRD